MKRMKAFTLIEVMIALALLAVLSGAVLALFPQSIFMGRVSLKYTLASNLAQEKMEELGALQYEEIGVGLIEPKGRISSDPQDSFYYFEREVEVTYVDSNLNPSTEDTSLKRIRVSVYFHEKEEKNVTLYTLFAKK